MKKVLSVLLLFIIAISLVACAKEENTPAVDEPQTTMNEYEYEDEDENSDVYIQAEFPLSVDYIDYVNPTYNESYKFAFLDVKDNYIKVIPHHFADLSFGSENKSISEIIEEYQDNLPQYFLETGTFYYDVSKIEFMNESFIESIEFVATNTGYYLKIHSYSSMQTCVYSVAKWSSSGKYQGLYRTGSNKFVDYYGYCGNYILEGFIKKTPAEEYILYFKDFTVENNYEYNEVVVIDLKQLENEFDIILDNRENGFCDIEGELSVETINSNEDEVVLSITNKTHNGIKTVIGKASLTNKRFEVIDTISYNVWQFRLIFNKYSTIIKKRIR